MRQCSACRKPTEGKCYYCRECKRWYDKQHRKRPGRQCGCGAVLLNQAARCKSCDALYRRKRAYAVGGRRCGSCGEPNKRGYRHHWCPACNSLYHAERRLQARSREEG